MILLLIAYIVGAVVTWPIAAVNLIHERLSWEDQGQKMTTDDLAFDDWMLITLFATLAAVLWPLVAVGWYASRGVKRLYAWLAREQPPVDVE